MNSIFLMCQDFTHATASPSLLPISFAALLLSFVCKILISESCVKLSAYSARSFALANKVNDSILSLPRHLNSLTDSTSWSQCFTGIRYSNFEHTISLNHWRQRQMLGKYVLSDCFLSTKLDATGVEVLSVGILSWNEEKSVSLHKTQHIHYMITAYLVIS